METKILQAWWQRRHRTMRQRLLKGMMLAPEGWQDLADDKRTQFLVESFTVFINPNDVDQHHARVDPARNVKAAAVSIDQASSVLTGWVR